MLGVDIENFIAECGDMLRDNDIRMTHRFREMVEAVLEECPSAVLKGYAMKAVSYTHLGRLAQDTLHITLQEKGEELTITSFGACLLYTSRCV